MVIRDKKPLRRPLPQLINTYDTTQRKVRLINTYDAPQYKVLGGRFSTYPASASTPTVEGLLDYARRLYDEVSAALAVSSPSALNGRYRIEYRGCKITFPYVASVGWVASALRDVLFRAHDRGRLLLRLDDRRCWCGRHWVWYGDDVHQSHAYYMEVGPANRRAAMFTHNDFE